MKRYGRLLLSLLGLISLLLLHTTGARSETGDTHAAEHDDIFKLQKYKPMYFIFAYDRTLPDRDPSFQTWEMQFQLSFKIPIVPLPFANGRLAFGYTQISYWQIFNVDNSSAFRETNYAPEVMAGFENNAASLGLDKVRSTIGLLHESNGMGGPGSRSWNRIYGEVKLDRDSFTLGVKPWYRIPERAKASPTDAKGDDNPDIERYLGYGELTAELREGPFTARLTGRNNLRESPNYGSLQLDITFLMKNDAQLYFQAFDGYGESLLDYNRHDRRFGLGFTIGALP